MNELKLILKSEPLYEIDRRSWAYGYINCLEKMGVITRKELAEIVNFVQNEIKTTYRLRCRKDKKMKLRVEFSTSTGLDEKLNLIDRKDYVIEANLSQSQLERLASKYLAVILQSKYRHGYGNYGEILFEGKTIRYSEVDE